MSVLTLLGLVQATEANRITSNVYFLYLEVYQAMVWLGGKKAAEWDSNPRRSAPWPSALPTGPFLRNTFSILIVLLFR